MTVDARGVAKPQGRSHLLAGFAQFRSKLERNLKEHLRQISEVEHEVFAILVPVSDPLKRLPARRKS